MPVLTIKNNNKFKFELGVSKLIEDTYRIDSNKLALTSSDEAESYILAISE
jgi:phage-related protein